MLVPFGRMRRAAGLVVMFVVASAIGSSCSGGGDPRSRPITPAANSPAAPTVSPVATIVAGLQEDLHDLGYGPGPVTGVFTSTTTAALVRFQTDAAVGERNALGPATARALAEHLRRSSQAVRALQSALTDVSLFHGSIDGRYGDDLLVAVDELQRRAHLPVDGEYGPQTATALSSLYAQAVPGTPAAVTTTTSVPQDTTTTNPDNMLQLGRQSARVAAVQARLTALGYRPGTVNGYFGADTASAVLAFEKREGLARDGTAGPDVQARSAAPTGAGPHAGLPAPRIEVDVAGQIAFVVLADGSVTTLNVSTGSGLTYKDPTTGAQDLAYTPLGTFGVQRKVDADVKAPLGTLHRPLYFYQGWAVHGAASVPAYPASHGCVRVSDDDADWLFPQVPTGTTVVIYNAGATGTTKPPSGATPGY